MKTFLAILLVWWGIAEAGGARAQTQQNALTVATCGSNVSYATGQFRPVTQNTGGQGCSSVVVAGTVTTTNASVGVNGATAPLSSTQIGFLSGTALVNISASNPLPVSSTGSTSNATSAVAASATNSPTVAYNYGFNGATWDQLQVDASKNLKVTVAAQAAGLSLLAGTPCATTALASSLTCKSAAGTLYTFNAVADATLSAAPWWVIIYNATSLPANGAVTPIGCFGGGNTGQTTLGASFGSVGQAMTTGIVVAVSTSGCFTQTASTHAYIQGTYN